MHKGREDEARHALARLMTMPPDSPEVGLELDEISTALEADRALGSGSYLGWCPIEASNDDC
jgi:MFS transporter, SP family, sugar:H+ symporter